MINKSNIIVLDTETTGLNPSTGDELLQLSIIDSNGSILFNEHFKPQIAAEWPQAMEVNKITPEFVADKKPARYFLDVIQNIFDNADIIVGYNTNFDLRFIKSLGVEISNKSQIIDVMENFAIIYGAYDEKKGNPKRQKLTKCAEYYNFDWSTTGTHAHDSLGDAYATLHCYKEIEKGMRTVVDVHGSTKVVFNAKRKLREFCNKEKRCIYFANVVENGMI